MAFGAGLASLAFFSFDAAAMKRIAIGLALICTVGLVACDSGDKKAGAKDAKAGDKKEAKADAKKAAADGGDAKADAKPEPAKPVKLAKVSLEDAGLDAVVDAPEGAKVAEDFGAFTVKAGDSFQLEIHTGAADLAARKKEIEGNDVNKLKKFHTESETALVYETEVMGKTEFHFLANKEIDGAKYYCEDTKGKAYSQADVEAMLKSCNSAAAS